MAYSKTYVVWEGRHPGIYSSWEDCKAEVENFPNARYKAFSNRTEAIMAYRESDREASEVLRSISRHLKEESAGYMSNPEINPDSIAVDAGCSGNPGKMEYRGVYLRTGKEVFHQGPFEHGTNNIGEFLAIVHALALLKKNGSNMTVYSDSAVAQKWVRDKRCNTKLEKNDKNSELHALILRAEAWLAANDYANPVMKWKTDKWGEIPADFGRK
ncbi:MAG: ribonuclease H family protein [Bacteroidetes bacterium]|uniref:Ribonuclease H n=1 Tax=Candidatus Limisoma faecipullorum TaxID=2840854 RepID=A0A9D9IQK4_9BACT|nr:ribonuclease H family protein [Candidatus Limisoma faecipullorum]